MAAAASEEIKIVLRANTGEAVANIKKAERSLNSFNKTANKTSSSESSTENVTSKLKEAYGKLSKKVSTCVTVVNKLSKAMSGWFDESNDYVESLNLFQVTMGEGAKAAKEYAETVQDAMGIDSKEWMNYQGSFNEMITGFGLSSDSANEMSQQLTQVAYDLSSLWNTDVSTAFNKLQSGMSGQVKGLKTWGINLSVAQLKETALAHGISLSTSQMTEGQKAVLRYVTIMEKSANAHNDLARTLVTPANAMRILSAQTTQLKRALGNIVSVLVAKFIPYIQIAVKWLTEMAKKIATAFGYELPDIDYSGLSSTADYSEETSEALDDANKNAKKLQRTLMGFDEINKLNDTDSSSSTDTSVLGGGLPDDLGIDLSQYDYDFLKGIDTSKAEKIKDILKDILWYVGAIATGFTTWDILKILKDAGLINLSFKSMLGIVMAVVGAIILVKGAIDGIANGVDLQNFIEMLSGAALLIGGIALAFGATGAAIAAVVAGIILVIVGIVDAVKNGVNTLNGLLIVVGTVIAAVGAAVLFGAGGWVVALVGVIAAAIAGAVVLIIKYKDQIVQWFQSVVNTIQSIFSPLVTAIKAVFAEIVYIVNGVYTAIATVINKIGEIISTIIQIIVALITYAVQQIKTFLAPVTTWFHDHITQPIKDFFDDAGEYIKKWFDDKIKDISRKVLEFATAASGIVKDVFNYLFGKIEEKINKFIYGLNVVVSMVNTIPNVHIDYVEPISIPRLASGGFVENQGQLFVAREAGAELVGNIGNRTGVVNNDQIVESVEGGVYKGVATALREYGNANDSTNYIVLEIDGDVLTKKVISGHNSIVKSTGSSPLLVGG